MWGLWGAGEGCTHAHHVRVWFPPCLVRKASVLLVRAMAAGASGSCSMGGATGSPAPRDRGEAGESVGGGFTPLLCQVCCPGARPWAHDVEGACVGHLPCPTVERTSITHLVLRPYYHATPFSFPPTVTMGGGAAIVKNISVTRQKKIHSLTGVF